MADLKFYSFSEANRDWSYKFYRSLLSIQSENRTLDTLSKSDFNSAVSYYFINTKTFPDDTMNNYAGMLSFISTKTRIPIELVEDAAAKASVFTVKKSVPSLEVIPLSNPAKTNYKLIGCGSISYRVPRVAWKTFKNQPNFRSVFLRYFCFRPDTGLFWSVEPKVYEFLASSEVQAIECFASPFNYNTLAFCSAFREDLRLDYGDATCYGDFFKYIELLGDHPDPVRLLLNPPYTDKVINKTGDVVEKYMEKNKNSEFVAVLPDWTNCRGIEVLKSIQGSAHRFLGVGDFTMRDPIEGKSFKPAGLKVIVIVNVSGDTEQSEILLEEVVQRMKEIASKIH